MRKTYQKTTPGVKNGKVQKKQNHRKTLNYWNTRQQEIQIDIEKPGAGYKHFLKKRDIQKFLSILPHFEEIEKELDCILLAGGGNGADGWYDDGILAICAWEKEMTVKLGGWYYEDHKAIFDRLNVVQEPKGQHFTCYFTEHQIKAYQLLHIFLHELGHHHDRISTKNGWPNAPRGEGYAESYAFKYEKIIWNRFFEVFPMV